MSQENVEALKAAMEAFNRRDGSGFDALLAEDAEIVPVRVAVERDGLPRLGMPLTPVLRCC